MIQLENFQLLHAALITNAKRYMFSIFNGWVERIVCMHICTMHIKHGDDDDDDNNIRWNNTDNNSSNLIE